jgi:hypothetical protein
MQRILASFAFAACVMVSPAWLSATERDACLDACQDEAVACEAQRCGVTEPIVDSTCGRVCGDRFKQCKASCPQ